MTAIVEKDTHEDRVVNILRAEPTLSNREVARRAGVGESTVRRVRVRHGLEKAEIRMLPLASIRTDGGTQLRASTDEAVIEAYAERWRAGLSFHTVPVVYFDGTDYWMADGFQRTAAAARADLPEIACEVRSGTLRDALLYAAGANEDHGVRRTVEDKRRSVAAVLAVPEWVAWRDREIARVCNVSHPFVAEMRDRLAGNATSTPPVPSANGPPEPVPVDVPGDPAPDEDQQYLDSIPLRAKLPERCRAIFDRDALKYRKALKWLDQGKAMGLAAERPGDSPGRWASRVISVLRLSAPHAWLRCLACEGGHTPDGQPCKACQGDGYVLP